MMDSGKVNAVELAKALITAYPSTHPVLSPVDFECCGGNDEIFKEHTMDCPYLAKVCIEGLLAERDELKGKLGKLEKALEYAREKYKGTIYMSAYNPQVLRNYDNKISEIKGEALKEISNVPKD